MEGLKEKYELYEPIDIATLILNDTIMYMDVIAAYLKELKDCDLQNLVRNIKTRQEIK
ncbi:hypothetical protein D1872_324400 [compost metagenome]